MILTTNVLLISVKTNSAVSMSKCLPTLFQVPYQTNQLFKLLETSTIARSKPETVDALEENATVEL